MSNIIYPGGFPIFGPMYGGPIPQVQPFTYSDALTYYDILAKLREYLEKLRQYMNTFPELVDSAIAEMIAEVDRKIAENKEWTQDKIDELTQYVNDTVELIINDSIQLQDPVMAGIMGNPSSQTRGVSDTIYAAKEIEGRLGINPRSVTNVDEIVETGWTRGGTGTIGAPEGGSWIYMTFAFSAATPPARNQIAYRAGGEAVYYRYFTSGAWSPWFTDADKGLLYYQDTFRRAVPSYVNNDGQNHSGGIEYDPVLNLFYESSTGMRMIRQYIALAKAGLVRVHAVCIGDSKTQGNGAGFVASYPTVLRFLLGGQLGMAFASHALTAWPDTSWTDVVGFNRDASDFILHLNARVGANSITYNAPSRSTGIRIWYDSYPGEVASHTVTIDNGSPQTITPTGTAVPPGADRGYYYMDITGLSNSSHKVKVDVNLTSGSYYFRGIEGLHETPGLMVSNAGLMMSAVSHWSPASTSRLSLYNNVAGVISKSSTYKIAFVNLGTNTSADEVAGYRVIIENLKSIGFQVMLLVPGGTQNTGSRLAMKRAAYEIARDLDVPLMDFTDLIGNSIAGDRGYMNDSLHENARGYRYEAIAMTKALT